MIIGSAVAVAGVSAVVAVSALGKTDGLSTAASTLPAVAPTEQVASPAPTPATATPTTTPTPSSASPNPGPVVPGIDDYPWAQRIAAAKRYAKTRPGTVGFVVVDEHGRLVGGDNIRNHVSSASVIKSMMLVAYLRRPEVRNRPLTESEQAVLTPMIRESNDNAATTVYRQWGVGPSGLARLAADAGMTGFETSDRWGLSQLTPADMAEYFYQIDKLVPKRHRAYAMDLLGSVVRQQQWGIPPVTPKGWKWYVKGGWIDGVVNQVALFTKGNRRFSLAVLIEGTPDTEEGVQHHPDDAVGTWTITGVVDRLLKGYQNYGPPAAAARH